MRIANDSSRYGLLSQSLHWVTLALLIVLYVTGKTGDVEADKPDTALFFWHASLGALVLLLAVGRILWLLVSPPPPLPTGMSRLSRLLATSMHVALYAMLIALPVSGWLAASKEGASVSVFGLVSIPPWEIAQKPAAVSAAGPAADEDGAGSGEGEAGEVFEEAHETLGNVLLVLVALHLLAALKHQFIDRDDLARRMLPSAGKPLRTTPDPRA